MLTYIDTMIGFAGVMLLLSLLVTMLVQGVVALLNLRGSSLLWGVALVIERTFGVKDAAQAEALAAKVLKHPTLSPDGRLAQAIRMDELLRILKELDAQGDAGEAFKSALAKASDGWKQIYSAIPVEDIEQLFPEDAEKAEKVLSRLRAKALAEMGELKAWFDTVMDRTSERFVTRTRLFTIVFGAALSVFLHVDSVGLLKQISSNAELRARLAQSADASLKMADDYAKKDAEHGNIAAEALQAARRDQPDIKLDAPISADLVTREQGVRWIRVSVKDTEARAVFERAYETQYDLLARRRTQDLADMASRLKDQLAQTELSLVPPAPKGWWTEDNHWIGVLMTALFLSLGAPFWYNLLRELGNLRPLLAGKVDESENRKL